METKRNFARGMLLILVLGWAWLVGCSQPVDADGTVDVGMISAAADADRAAVPASIAAAAGDALPAGGASAAPAAAQVNTAVLSPARPAGNGNGNGNGNAGADCPAGCTPPPSGDLSEQEAASLLFMREEEKLARDVYQLLFASWNLPVFQTVAASEQAHMDSVLGLLQTYGLDDPAAGMAPGEFVNLELQALYDTLAARGALSMADALLAGGAIEEIDILDLQARIAETDNADIIWVYGNLLSGSENHLRAFVTNYERQTGLVYAPQYLPQEVFDLILSGSSGNGEQRRGGGGGQGGSGGRGGGGNGRGGNGNGRSGGGV